MYFRQADKEDLVKVTELLAESFLDYPLFCVIEENQEKRYSLVYELQYINTQLYIAKHQCFVVMDDRKLIGVALLKDLQKDHKDFWSYIYLGFFRLLKKGLMVKVIQYLKLMNGTSVFSQQENAWYLDSFAVSKKAQGLGLGSEILQCVIFSYIKEHGGGQLFLSTNTEWNRKFYQKNGFDEYKETKLTLNEHSVKDWSYRKKIPGKYS